MQTQISSSVLSRNSSNDNHPCPQHVQRRNAMSKTRTTSKHLSVQTMKTARTRIAFLTGSLILAGLVSQTAQSAIIIGGNPFTPTTVIASSQFSETFAPTKAFNGLAGSEQGWATTFPAVAAPDTRNEWLIVDLGQEVTINSIGINWELARAADYTWRILSDTDYNNLGTVPVNFVPGSVTYSDWTQIASADTTGAPDSANNPGLIDQVFDFDLGTTSDATHAGITTMTVNDNTPRGRWLLFAATETWGGQAGFQPWEFEISATVVPEPSTCALAVLGLLGVLTRGRRRMR
jgi:hypothetical protein